MSRIGIATSSSSSFAATLTVAAFAAVGCSNSSTPTTPITVPASGLVVLNSDYTSTSVSLVDPSTRAVTHDACVSSTTSQPQLSLALSGDVVLPSRPQAGGDVVLIDDVNNALTWVDPQTCNIRHQLSIADFKSFPHDVISVSPDKAYVTRYGTNANPTSDPMSRGEDLLIVNPRATSGPAITGRIDMAPFAAPVAGAVTQARPDRGLLVGDKAYVSLGSQSSDYLATGEARIVIVDTATDTVSGMIALPGLAGCEALEYLDENHTLYAACGGASSDADQAARAGIALIDLAIDPPAISKVVPGSAFGGPLVSFYWVAPFSGDLLFAATFGALDPKTYAQLAPDALWSVTPSDAKVTKMLESGAYAIGRAVLQTAPGVLFVPDGDPAQPLVHMYNVSSTAITAAGDIDANPSTHLAPRDVARY